MKHLSLKLLAETVVFRRKALKLSQAAVSEKTGINRSILSRLETEDYTPTVDQLLALASALDFPANGCTDKRRGRSCRCIKAEDRCRGNGLCGIVPCRFAFSA